ncbi:hypothetical protein BKA82DRAFT_932039 [Pisolithus tinctorius]|uniref:Uncharacterized protein n=1 Tax=Pisolithus tinctorius Marx 270 TaxID=870435 RepID=A0A0C3NLL5_PISTI|nr:hypothetical protein BKA82DRAFT_932039 [Pisolithus tinctorius]KIN96525.1 hypothetical protein M404DRAFT_932039 [Pisolithus tinctorius Marx 270]
MHDSSLPTAGPSQSNTFSPAVPSFAKSFSGPSDFHNRQPNPPAMKHKTPSWENRSTFRSSPYPKCIPSSTSMVTSTSSPLSIVTKSHGHGPGSVASGGSSGNARSVSKLEVMLAEKLQGLSGDTSDREYQIALLKNERHIAKYNMHMCMKEIEHDERERQCECSEADKIHHCILEMRNHDIQLCKLDAEAFSRESEVLKLKLKLVEIEAQKALAAGGQASSSATPTSSIITPADLPLSLT